MWIQYKPPGLIKIQMIKPPVQEGKGIFSHLGIRPASHPSCDQSGMVCLPRWMPAQAQKGPTSAISGPCATKGHNVPTAIWASEPSSPRNYHWQPISCAQAAGWREPAQSVAPDSKLVGGLILMQSAPRNI